MFVGQILSAKGDQVVSAEPDASIAEIARLLKYHRIGAVVVTDAGGDLGGIITERDLAHGLADHGAKVLDMRVDQLMTGAMGGIG
jgi:CBS domain-containing protein